MNNGVDCTDRSDEELVTLCISNKEHLSCVIERYERPLARYIRRLTALSPDDVTDILQEIFIKVYINLNSFDTNLKFSSWIYRIAHNVVISHHRKLSARPEGNLIDVDDTVLASIAAETNLVAESDTRILKKHLNEALSRLPLKYREVLILRFFDERDYEEMSDILKKPIGTIATLLNRAKKKLREAFISLGYSSEYGQE